MWVREAYGTAIVLLQSPRGHHRPSRLLAIGRSVTARLQRFRELLSIAVTVNGVTLPVRRPP